MYRVRLVNRSFRPAVNNQPLQLSGLSGKVYGQSFYQPEHQGMVFEMSVEEYEAAKFDLVGNLFPGQQWVPEFFEDKTVATRKLVEWNELVKRGKAAGVYKNRMTRKELLEALGEKAA